MEPEETREILLPNWQGSGSHGITIAQTDDGVFVRRVQQNSPAARMGVVQEGGHTWRSGPTWAGLLAPRELLSLSPWVVSPWFQCLGSKSCPSPRVWG